MKDRTKIIIIAVIVVLLAIGGFLGISYVLQRSSMRQGITYLDKGEYQKAYESFDKASSKVSVGYTKQKVDVMYYKGEALYRLKRYQDAIDVYDGVLNHKETSKGYAMKALCYMGLNKESKAVSVCDQGISSCRDEGESFDVKIGILMNQKKYDEALSVIDTALNRKISSGKADIMFDQICIYEEKLDYQKAYECAKEYVKAYPNDTKGKNELTFLQSRI